MAQSHDGDEQGNWHDPPMVGATTSGQAAAAGVTHTSGNTGSESVNGSQLRDKDPPPTYDGSNPEVTFRQFEKSVKLWQFETDVPLRKQGAKLLRALTGSARLAVDDLEFEDIANEDGIKNLLNRLKEYYMPHLEVSLPRAFENAVYGQQRQAKESFAEYVHRLERAFALLSKEGVDLPKGATGYILYRQAGLTEAQDQRVLTWCEGRYDRDSIVKALRRLDKVLKEKSSKASYATEGYEVFENDQVNQSEEHLGDSDQEFIYVAEGDLDGIYEEKDMLEALASYREVRQALKEQKTNRGFFPGKGFGGFKDGGKSKGKSRVHKEQLKLRTRCWKCGQIGHISAECTNKVVIKEGTSQASSSGSTGKSSFFVSTAEDIGVAAGMHGETSHDFWLRNFVERRAKTRNNSPCEADAAYKSATIGGQTHQDCGFHGIVTCSFEGVVDTAAEGGLIGSFALKRLQHELNQLGLCCRWTPKTSAAKGVGGQAQVVGVILIPLGLGGINGVLETTVVEGDVPLLLPIRLLKTLDAIINIPEHHVFFGKHAVTVPMRELSSGHMVIRVTEFAQAGFQVPEELQSQYDFRCGMEERETNAVMLAQQRLRPGTTSPRSVLSPCASLRPDGRAGESNSKCGKTQGGDGADDFKCSSGRAAFNTEGCAKLAGDVGQAMHFAGNGGVARGYRRLVPTIIGAGILALVRDQAGGHLCRDHSERTGYEAFADQRTPSEISKRMCAPKEQVEGRWQQSRILDSMSRIQFEMGESVQGDGGEERLEEGEPREETGSLSQDMGTAMVPEDMEVEMAMGEVPNVNQALTFADTTMDMNAAQVAQNLEYKMWEAQESMRAQMEDRMMQMMMEWQNQRASSSQEDQLQWQQLQSMLNEMREKTLRQEAMIQVLQRGAVESPPMTAGPMENQRLETGSEAGASTLAGAVRAPNVTTLVLCHCQEPAERLRVNKEGPRQGRTFWKCTQRLCNFFSGM